MLRLELPRLPRLPKIIGNAQPMCFAAADDVELPRLLPHKLLNKPCTAAAAVYSR